jgi:hypothetical protein
MQFESFSFGSIQIDGIAYDHDVVIDGGEVSKREKKPSKKFRRVFGHTPLSTELLKGRSADTNAILHVTC